MNRLPISQVVTDENFETLRAYCDNLFSHPGRIFVITYSSFGEGRKWDTKFSADVSFAHRDADAHNSAFATYEFNTIIGHHESFSFSAYGLTTSARGHYRWENREKHGGRTPANHVRIEGLGDGSNPSRIDSITVKYRTRDNAESITQIDFLSRNDIEENEDML